MAEKENWQRWNSGKFLWNKISLSPSPFCVQSSIAAIPRPQVKVDPWFLLMFLCFSETQHGGAAGGPGQWTICHFIVIRQKPRPVVVLKWIKGREDQIKSRYVNFQKCPTIFGCWSPERCPWRWPLLRTVPKNSDFLCFLKLTTQNHSWNPEWSRVFHFPLRTGRAGSAEDARGDRSSPSAAAGEWQVPPQRTMTSAGLR